MVKLPLKAYTLEFKQRRCVWWSRASALRRQRAASGFRGPTRDFCHSGIGYRWTSERLMLSWVHWTFFHLSRQIRLERCRDPGSSPLWPCTSDVFSGPGGVALASRSMKDEISRLGWSMWAGPYPPRGVIKVDYTVLSPCRFGERETESGNSR